MEKGDKMTRESVNYATIARNRPRGVRTAYRERRRKIRRTRAAYVVENVSELFRWICTHPGRKTLRARRTAMFHFCAVPFTCPYQPDLSCPVSVILSERDPDHTCVTEAIPCQCCPHFLAQAQQLWAQRRVEVGTLGRQLLTLAREQGTVVGHDVAERCRCAQPIQSRATRQRRTAQDGPGWIAISSNRCVCHEKYLVHRSRRRSERLVSAMRLEHACVLSPAQWVGIPPGSRHVLMHLLSDGHASDAGIALDEGYASWRFADALWLRSERRCAAAQRRHANDERYEAVAGRWMLSRW